MRVRPRLSELSTSSGFDIRPRTSVMVVTSGKSCVIRTSSIGSTVPSKCTRRALDPVAAAEQIEIAADGLTVPMTPIVVRVAS